MSAGQLCMKEGCRNYAIHQVHVRAVAIPGLPTADIKLELYVCEKHSTIALTDIYDEKLWENIQREFTMRGKMAPSYKKSYVFLEDYVDPLSKKSSSNSLG